MFDPLFPVALFGGPLALAILLRVEASRTTASIWPHFSSAALAFVATWGLSYWGLIVGVILTGEGMKEGGFDRLIALAVLTSMVAVVASYSFVARHRVQELRR